MIYQNLELFNIRGVEEVPGVPGPRLCRVPALVRNKLNPRARMQGMDGNCGEIRFVTDAPMFLVHLMARRTSTWPQPINPMLRVMVGNLEHSMVELPLDVMTTIPLDALPLLQARPEVLRPEPQYGFAQNVWRFVLPGAEIIFGGVETHGYAIRPPTAEEKPSFRCLCHGSSITNSYTEGWPALMGNFLGIDVLNLGQAGSNQLEPAMCDFVAGLDEYDGIVLEPGINICGNVSTQEFSQRLDYLLKAVVDNHPKCKIALITIFPYISDPNLNIKPANELPPVEEFRQIIRNAAKDYSCRGYDVTLVEGPKLETPSRCWSVDMVHPRHMGNALIAYRLAEILQKAWNLPPF